MALPFVDITQTITDDQTPASGVALIFNANNIVITIDTHVAVISRDSTAVANGFPHSGNTLINNGTVFGAAFYGFVSADNVDTIVVNNAGASITGLQYGVVLDDDGSTVINRGAIAGLQNAGVRFAFDSDAALLNNAGDIFGRSAGVETFSTHDGGIFRNSGSIRSDGYGLHFSFISNSPAVIDNKIGGLIAGGIAGIMTDDSGGALGGRIALTNHGTVSGGIDCNATNGNVNDAVFNHGKIIGQVHLGLGNDVFKGNKGTSGKVFGEDGNDTLIGSTHNDQIDGGAGLDLIRGGRGKDLLFGGADRDLFDFNSIKESVKGSNRDQILDFHHGTNVTGDDIDLRTIDAKTGVAGNQAFKFIGKQGFHDVKGELRYIDKGATCIAQGDVNGDGKADFEIFVNVGSLVKGDFLL